MSRCMYAAGVSWEYSGMCVDDLPHGLYTCCAYILGDLVDVDVTETNSQPADKGIDL